MAIWKEQIEEVVGSNYPWKGFILSKNGKRQDSGEFMDKKHAEDYAHQDAVAKNCGEKPAEVAQQVVEVVESTEVVNKQDAPEKPKLTRRKK